MRDFSLVLPELVSGRGTTRRVVEGETLRASRNDALNHCPQIGQNLARWDAQGCNASLRKPRIARSVARGPVTHAMSFAIDFNCKTRIAAKEVEHIGPARLLDAYFEGLRARPRAPGEARCRGPGGWGSDCPPGRARRSPRGGRRRRRCRCGSRPRWGSGRADRARRRRRRRGWPRARRRARPRWRCGVLIVGMNPRWSTRRESIAGGTVQTTCTGRRR